MCFLDYVVHCKATYSGNNHAYADYLDVHIRAAGEGAAVAHRQGDLCLPSALHSKPARQQEKGQASRHAPYVQLTLYAYIDFALRKHAFSASLLLCALGLSS